MTQLVDLHFDGIISIDHFDELVVVLFIWQGINIELHFIIFFEAFHDFLKILFLALIIVTYRLFLSLGLVWVVGFCDLYRLRLLLEWTKSEREHVETILILILFTVLHHVELGLHKLKVLQTVQDVVFLASARSNTLVGIFNTSPIKEVLKVVHLSNLRADCQRLFVLGTCFVIMIDGILNLFEHLGVQQIAADNEARATLACLAMHSDDWVLQEVVLDHLEFLIQELVAVMVTGEAVDDVVSFLDTPLDKEEHV